MTTRTKLQEIKSGSELEELVVPILRRINPDYQHLIHTGVNSKGNTIKDPVDGIVKVKKNEVLNFILFEFTTEKKLESKWLKDASKSKGKTVKDGDVIKAAKLAEKYKKEFPGSIFRICLCTNQDVNSDLYFKVEQKCQALEIQLDLIIDFKELKDFLDNSPEGHWIRQQYLGIQAELLSPSLLKDVCNKSLEEYKTDISYDDSIIITRQIEESFKRSILNFSTPTLFLSGVSGMGKSIMAYSIISQLTEDYYVLRLRDKYVIQESSLANALYAQLKEHIPNLFQTHLQDIFSILGNKKLLLVIEDINTVPDASSIIKKVLNWTVINNSNDNESINYPYKIICPIWRRHLSSFHRQNQTNHSNIDTIELGQFSEEESLNVLTENFKEKNIKLSRIQIQRIATSLNNDPFLIGIYRQFLNDSTSNFLSLSNQILDKYLKREISVLAEKNNTSTSSIDYHLNQFAHCLLQRKELRPSYKIVRKWYKELDISSDILDKLEQGGNIFRFNPKTEILFKHDRIRDALLIKVIVEVLEDVEIANEILEEPFFAEIIGQAIAKTKLDDNKLQYIIDKNPLSVFVALQYMEVERDDYFEEYIEKLKTWVNDSMESKSINSTLLWELQRSLYNTDLKEVLELTEKFRYNYLGFAARFRNGNIWSGICFLAVFVRHEGYGFEPAADHTFRDEVITIAKSKYYECAEDAILDYLKIEQFEEEKEFFRYAIILLAGYWRSDKLTSHIFSSWKNAVNPKECLLYAIWAVIQCGGDRTGEHLQDLLDYWINLEVEEIDFHRFTKSLLPKCNWTNLPENTVTSLLKIAKSKEKYASILFRILLNIDHHKVFPWIIERLGKQYKNNNGAMFSEYASLSKNLNPYDNKYKAISKPTLNKLWSIWSNSDNNIFQRIAALDIWLSNAKEIDIIHFKNISLSDDERIVEKVLSKRIELGDKTVVDVLYEQLINDSTNDSILFKNINYIWNNELIAVITQYYKFLAQKNPKKAKIQELEPPYYLTKSIKKLPAKQVEAFLEKFWIYSGQTPSFVQIALLISTPRLRELAKNSIKTSDFPSQLFKALSIIYGFRIFEEHELITLKSLEGLLEYVEYLSMKNMEEIADHCCRNGWIEWSRKNVLPHLGVIERTKWKDEKFTRTENLRITFFPDMKTIKTNLLERANRNRQYISDTIIQEFEQKGISRTQFFSLLEEILKEELNINTYKYVAECIQVAGTREELKLLDLAQNDDSPEFQKIRIETIYNVKRRVL